ncbi:MAG TPA: hypothetical protein VLA72_12850, partial [Anaerolineales bacterium]|nr:hypothetical protein [Anaerolineales bacterium]
VLSKGGRRNHSGRCRHGFRTFRHDHPSRPVGAFRCVGRHYLSVDRLVLADWPTTLAQVPVNRVDMLVIDWDLLPNPPGKALDELRKACPTALVIVLISYLTALQQAALSAGADAFISKGELPERVAERLRTVAASAIRN